MKKLNRVLILVCSLFMLLILGGCGNKTAPISEEMSSPVSEAPTVTDLPLPPRVYNNLMTEAEKSKVLVEQSAYGQKLTFYDEEIDQSYVFELLMSSNYDESKEASTYVVLGSDFNATEYKALRDYLDKDETQTLLAIFSMEGNDTKSAVNRDYVKGVQAFDAFLTDNLLGWMVENYKINTEKICLTGYETAGYFASYVLHTRNSVLNYLIISPELFKDTDSIDILTREETYYSEGNTVLSANVCLLRMMEDEYSFASTIADNWIKALTEHSYSGFVINNELLAGAGHYTSDCESLLRGMCYFNQKEFGESEKACIAASKVMTEVEKESITIGELSKDHLLYEEITTNFPSSDKYISEIVMYDEEIDDSFVIHISLPEGYKDNQKYPLVLMTDGVWRLSDHPELRQLMTAGEVEEVILVSVGYPNSYDYMKIRERDLLTQPDLYLQFLVDNLMPYLCDNYSVDTARTTLTGHSYGGYWGFYALFHSDTLGKDSFAYYYLGSPSFQASTNRASARNFENWFYDSKQILNCSVYVTVGGNEEPAFINMISTFMEDMKKHTYEGLSMEYEIIEGFDHNTVFKPSIKNTMLKFYGTE